MNKLSIIYNQSLTQVQGINYVNNSFVMGCNYFKENGIVLDKIFSPTEVFGCVGKNRLDLIGSNIGSASYARVRKLRTILKIALSSDYLMGASIKLYFNYYRSAKKAVKRYLANGEESDYILFQDAFSAYYFNKYNRTGKPKTALLLHCSNEPLEQMRPSFKGVFGKKWFGKLVDSHVAAAIDSVDKVIYLSDLAVRNSSVSGSKKTYIYNGVEDYPIGEINAPQDIINVVTVGSVIEHKGQHLVIEALGLMAPNERKRYHYHVIGNGDYLPYCKELVAKFGLEDNVTFYGARNNVAELLKDKDVFILPSRSEGMPMSIIEAMRQGLFILGTKTGGIPEMITLDYGRLITRNPKDIVSILFSLYDEHLISKNNKEKSRQRYCECFSLKKMINSYSSVFNSL